VPLGRGEPLVRSSGVESVALLVLVLRQGARCTRRLTCATRTGHSLLLVLPPKELLEPSGERPRDEQLAQLFRPPIRWRYLSPTRHFCTLSCRFRSFRAKVSRLCPRSDRLRCTDAAKVSARDANLFGQGIVLADTKTARLSLRIFVPSSGAVGALNAFGLSARALWHGGRQHNRPFRRAPQVDTTS
jgi:hypothetical protein